jgi:glycosyltransferase involved in cell wall biosynthesis
MTNNKSKNILLIIGNLYDDPIPQIVLNKKISILKKIFNVRIIAGGYLDEYTENRFNRKNKSIFFIIYESVKRQFRTFKYINQSEFDFALILLPFLIIPIVYIKLIKSKPVYLYMGGRASISIRGEIKSGNYFKLPLYWLIKIIEYTSFKLSDFILVDSHSSINFLGLTKFIKKIKIYSNYIDLDLFKVKRNIKNRKPILGYVGRIDNEKGIWEFIQTAELIRHSKYSVKFLIVGDGNESVKLKKYLKLNKELSEITEFIEWVNNNKMPDVLNELLLLILPSYSEGTPNIVLEAMSCGTPVLVTPVGGVPKIIKDDENGYIIPKNSPEIIFNKVVSILEKDDLAKISQNARSFMEENYNFHKSEKTYKCIFQCVP